MKALNFLSRKISYVIFFTFLFSGSFAQNQKPMTCIDSLLMNPEYNVQIPFIEKMRGEGYTDNKICDMIEAKAKEHKDKMMRSFSEVTLERNNKGAIVNTTPAFTSASCSGDTLGIPSGTFGLWTGETECWSTGSICTYSPWVPATLPVPGRIQIISTPSTDTYADQPGFPIKLPSPYGGSYTIKLGNNITGAESERLTYKFTVQQSDINFIYQYAVVFQDPGHAKSEQPFFDFFMLTNNGDTIPCSHKTYVAKQGLAGFHQSSSAGAPVYYTTWNLVGVNLGSYVGQQVKVVCTTADCSLCGHFGYTYLDFSCGASNTSQFCMGEDSVLLIAPLDPSFSYNWSTGQTTSSIIVNPQLTTTVTVHITQASSTCGFDFGFTLAPTIVTPSVTYTVNCGTGAALFTNNTTVTGGTVSSWNWQFPGGTPSSSNAQNPGSISYPPGNYTVTLTTTTQAGCVKTFTQPITVGADPKAQFTHTKRISCEGMNVQFNNTSQNATGWMWNFGDGTSSILQNPSHIYPHNGTYTVTLTAVSPPCKDVVTAVVTIGTLSENINVANVFTPNGDGINDCFKPVFLAATGDTLTRCIDMEIFDRWGVKVYESSPGHTDPVCWDGNTMHNAKAKDGTYYYIIKFGESTYKGYVTLLRGDKK